MKRVLVCALTSALLLSGQPSGQPQEQALTVCDLLARRLQYADKLVTVRGEIKVGPHGSWLAADPECKYQLVTRGVTWERVIWLQNPLNRSSEPLYHADFEADLRAEQKLDSSVREQHFNLAKDRLVETFVGLFRTYADADLDHRVNPILPPNSALRTLGFGPGGYAPAMLLIKTAKDATVIHGVYEGK
jgi:hypothetical protein